MLPQKSRVPATISQAARARAAEPPRPGEPDQHDRDDAKAVKELELHGGLEAAQRLRVGERQRMAADGACDRRDEQREAGRRTAASFFASTRV